MLFSQTHTCTSPVTRNKNLLCWSQPCHILWNLTLAIILVEYLCTYTALFYRYHSSVFFRTTSQMLPWKELVFKKFRKRNLLKRKFSTFASWHVSFWKTNLFSMMAASLNLSFVLVYMTGRGVMKTKPPNKPPPPQNSPATHKQKTTKAPKWAGLPGNSEICFSPLHRLIVQKAANCF